MLETLTFYRTFTETVMCIQFSIPNHRNSARMTVLLGYFGVCCIIIQYGNTVMYIRDDKGVAMVH